MNKIPTEPDENRPDIILLQTNNLEPYIYKIRYKKVYYTIWIERDSNSVVEKHSGRVICKLSDLTPETLTEINIVDQPNMISFGMSVLLLIITCPLLTISSWFSKKKYICRNHFLNLPPIILEDYQRIASIGRQLEHIDHNDIKAELDKISKYLHDAMISKY